MKSIDDVVEFYKTPVETTLPVDKMVQNGGLPKNLHLIQDYTRFNLETDEMFGGKSAFPKSSTIITG